MASDYYDKDTNDKQVSDGDTCYADDLNKVNNATNTAFEMVEDDVDDALASSVENAGLSKEWAVNDAGDLPSNPAGDPPNTEDYSSKANAGEAEGWVLSNYAGAPLGNHLLADGNVFTERGAKVLAEECAADAADAVAAAAEAIAANTISEGNRITVVKTGTDPYDYEVGVDENSNLFASTNTAQTITHNTSTKLEYNLVYGDNLGEYSSANSRFTVDEGGYYLITGQILYTLSSWPINTYSKIYIYKNGVSFFASLRPLLAAQTAYVGSNLSAIITLSAGDYIELWAFQNSGSSQTVVVGTVNHLFSIARVG